ncbi:hypothetical protein DDB_G0276505 [Dictyostelium discoideum AX4]|uniref:Uncharacterized protein n=1 Tax=Dictyostelium discoideum TaxID=44689 RepID=Q551K1_DICDI|nr:hypothetical protein DDB_G0276505 [Dictyostelium discoideum AX4]EAL69206.1 hypothetical protein DDB_G0276505 [Dictyostelium discoideum AX4]|eukprot:XP_643133.1 hypothetical protein DDB_G0276505 [Dictyostelium discoideum AX4]
MKTPTLYLMIFFLFFFSLSSLSKTGNGNNKLGGVGYTFLQKPQNVSSPTARPSTPQPGAGKGIFLA